MTSAEDKAGATTPVQDAKTSRYDIAFLVVLACIVFLIDIAFGSLRHWDEGIYGAAAKEMLARGEWLTAYFNGEVFHNKPPLYLWCVLIMFRIVGVCEYAVRFPSAICGAGTVIVLYLSSARLWDRKTALVAALLLLTTPHFLEQAKHGRLEVMLTFWLALAVYFFILAQKNRNWYFAAGAAVGMGLMTKQVVALILFPGIVGAYVLLVRDFTILKSWKLYAGALLALVVAAPWHIYQIAVWEGTDTPFIGDYFLHHVVHRVGALTEAGGAGLTEQGKLPAWFYLGVMVENVRPWFPFLWVAVPVTAYRAVRTRDFPHGVTAAWGLAIFALYSAAISKTEWYIVAAYPGMALCLAVVAGPLWRKRAVLPFVCFLLAVLIAIGFTARKTFRHHDYEPQIKAMAAQIETIVPRGGTIYILDYIGDISPSYRFYVDREFAQLTGVDGDAERPGLKDVLPGGRAGPEEEGRFKIAKPVFVIANRRDVFDRADAEIAGIDLGRLVLLSEDAGKPEDELVFFRIE